MSAVEAERAFLGTIGDGLLRHLVVVGRLGLLHASDRGRLMNPARMIAIARCFFREVERIGHVPSGLAEHAYIYNKSDWSDELPPGGYLGEQPSLLRSQLVRSFDSMWSLHREHGAAKGPALRAATWICCDRGFAEAIRYLFDLQRGGLIAGIRTLSETLMVLVGARAQVDQAGAVSAVVFREPPTSQKQWLTAEFSEDLSELARDARNSADAVGLVLQECLRDVDCLRAAQNYDAWFVGKASQASILQAALLVVKSLSPERPLPLLAMLDGLEEIMADASALYVAVIGGPLLRANFSLARAVSREIAKLDGTTWKRRVLEERVLLPAALGYFLDLEGWLTMDEDPSMPPEWSGLSSDIAYPVVTAIRGPEPSPWTRIAPFPRDHPGDEARLRKASESEIEAAAAEASGLEEKQAFAAAIDVYRRLLDLYPWCHFMRIAWAHTLRMSKDYDGALVQVCKALFGRPNEQGYWHCLEDVYRDAGMVDGATVARSVREMVCLMN